MEQSASELREVSLDEAMSIAILLQQNGKLADAAEVYRKILEKAPNHADALHFSGVLAHQQGRSDEAIALIERSIELDPNQADSYSNLGIIFKARGKLDDAIAAYERAIALNPSHANAHNNIGVLLKAQGQLVEAETAYRKAIELNPDHIDAWHNLGVLLAGLKRTKEAVYCYCKVTTLSPKHPEARRLLALAYRTLGEPEKAVKIFEDWLADDPANPVALHMHAACSGRNVPSRASDAYVEKVFDDFANSFDVKLAQLSYNAPKLVAALLDDAGLEPSKSLDVLDAGCGTGLCGPLVAPYARRLIGVDLSAGMLAQASEKQVYDELVKGELTEYVRGRTRTYDVILSADTLVYFGDLSDFVAAAANALRPQGMLIFTVEADTQADPPSAGFALRHHGRYTHTPEYIERLLIGAGLRPHIVHAELRMEAGAPVTGLAVRGTLIEREGSVPFSESRQTPIR